MKKLWRRATGIIKDRNSIWTASLTTRKPRRRNAELERAVIRATSHDNTYIDYKNAQRVFAWVRTSPAHLIMFLQSLKRRVERTHDWVVALKSLILMHGVLCTKAPGTRAIGRLPFDLSDIDDEFVRVYFAFADAKSVVMAAEMMEDDEEEGNVVDLARVKRLQGLVDMLLQVRPHGAKMIYNVVVLEAMDCMIIEVFALYSRICEGIAKALMWIYTYRASKTEATMALNVLHKANRQAQELSKYFEFCRKIGLLHATEFLKVEEIPKDDFYELERIINGSEASFVNGPEASSVSTSSYSSSASLACDEEVEQAKKPRLKSVITDKWEVFEEDNIQNDNVIAVDILIDPFADSLKFTSVSQHYNPFLDYGGTSSQLAS